MNQLEFNEMVKEEYRGGTVIVNVTVLLIIPVLLILIFII